MTNFQYVEIKEAQYVDPRAGNDKFYRTFVFGSCWVSQYGRNGTLGTFTKIVDAGSPEKAQQQADAKFTSKVKKGYEPSRAGSTSSAAAITAENITVLDTFAQLVPANTFDLHVSSAVPAVAAMPAVPAQLSHARRPDLTGTVAASLSGIITPHPAQNGDVSPALPVRPMLASVQDVQVVQDALVDPDWVAQFKYDGDRVVIEVVNGELRVLNRQGEQKTRNVGQAHLEPFTALHVGRWVFDGEIVGRTLVLFDLIMATDGTGTWADEETRFTMRYMALTAITEALGIHPVDEAPEGASVVLAPVAITAEARRTFLDEAVLQQREGIILRHCDGTYESGRRSTWLVKHKLIKDADVIVTALSTTKSSATLSVYNAAGKPIEVGQASTIGKGAVQLGEVWVVTYLYVTDPQHPRLVQPRLVRRRSDKGAPECLIDQFADAGTARIV